MKNSCLILVLLFSAGCAKKEIPDTVLNGLDYYPVTLGKFVVYDVDSTIFTEIPRDTISYQYRIKEKLADSFTDNEGKPAIRLERYIKKFNASKPYDSLAWTMKEVWMVNAGTVNVQVSEGNVRYTKLVFPVSEKATWNGNAANTAGEWNYIYDYVDKPETIGNHKLEKVLMVKQKNDSSAISHKRYTEKYASGIGLVEKKITEIFSNNVVAGKPVELRIEKGIIYKQTLVTYGHE